MKLAKDSIITLSARLLTVVFNLFILMVTTRILGSEGRGVYALVVLVVTVLRNVSGLGIEFGNVFFMGKKRIPEDRLVSNSFCFSVVLGLFTIFIFFVLIQFFNLSIVQDIPRDLLIISISILPFFLFSVFASYIFLGRKNIFIYNLLQVAHPGVFCIELIYVMLFHTLYINNIFYFWASAHILTGFIAVSFFMGKAPIRFRFFTSEAKRTVAYGLKGYISSLINFLNYRFDFFMINRFLTLTQVGYYSIAVVMAEVLLHVPYTAGTVILSKVSNVSESEANIISPKMSRHVFFLLLLTTFVYSLSATIVFPILFSDQFNAALKPFYLLLPGIIALGSSKVILNDLAGRGMIIINMYVTGITFILQIGLNLLLIPSMGISGASVASSITYILSTCILVILFIRIAKTDIRTLFIINKEDLKVYGDLWKIVYYRIRKL